MIYPNFLLKPAYKWPLVILLLISTTFGMICFFGDYQPPFLTVHFGTLTNFTIGSPHGNVNIGNGGNNLGDELAAFFMLLSLLGLMFCAEKYEDEFIGKLRLNAMYWAMVVNIILLVLVLFVIYDVAFFIVMVANIFSVPMLFLLRFHWTLSRTKSQSDEK
jgi:uncharacterized integral membrane protein